MNRKTLASHGLPVLDQGLSSITNFLAVFVLAGSLSSGEFGVFAMVYTVLTLFVGVTRSFFGLPLALAAHRSEVELSELYRSSVTAICWISVPIALMVFGVGALASLGADHESVRIGLWAAAAVGIATPMVMVQDVSRYFAISRGTPGAAVLSDAVWLAGIVSLYVAGQSIEPLTVILGWTGAIAASLAVVLLRFTPRLRGRDGLRLLIPKRGLRESISITVVLSTGVTLVMGFLMLPFLGASAVGSIRGAGTLFGPVNTLMAVLDFSVLGQLSRRDRSKDAKYVVLIALIVCGVSAVWAALLLVLPDYVGRQILGETWEGARRILPITSVEYLLLCLAASLMLIPKLRNRAKVLLMNRVWASVAILGATGLALALGGDVMWMAMALLLGAIVSTVGLLGDVRKELRAN